MYSLLIVLGLWFEHQLSDLWILSAPAVGAAERPSWEPFALLFLAALAVLSALLAWFWTRRQA